MKRIRKTPCGARTRSGGTCKRAPMPNGRCRLHGGLSPAPGPTHPTYKHGRYSKALEGESIAALYDVARTDPKLLALREDIALLVAKQQETIARLRTGESRVAWEAIASHTDQLRAAQERGDAAACTAHLHAVRDIAAGSMGDDDVWREYSERAEHIRRLVDTERKYEEALRLYIPLERANAIMGVWLDAIRRVLPPEHIARLHDEVRRVRADMPYLTAPATGRVH